MKVQNGVVSTHSEVFAASLTEIARPQGRRFSVHRFVSGIVGSLRVVFELPHQNEARHARMAAGQSGRIPHSKGHFCLVSGTAASLLGVSPVREKWRNRAKLMPTARRHVRKTEKYRFKRQTNTCKMKKGKKLHARSIRSESVKESVVRGATSLVNSSKEFLGKIHGNTQPSLKAKRAALP